jgi:(2Fe-2S) ferredoxin
LSPAGTAFRCSQASLDSGDDLAGSASTVRSFLLVEAEGAWGTQALSARLLPERVRTLLRELERRHRVRPLMIRRAGRRVGDDAPVTVFAAHTDPADPWLERGRLDRFEDLLDLDVSGFQQGRRPGLTPYDGPLFLVCTHGRHDACCAERGRPVWLALRHAEPDRTWQVSHIGGDRFAANVVVLPDGLYYGRVAPLDAARLADAHRQGRILLDRLRGRTAYPFAVQAAEIFLRRATGLLGVDDLRLVAHHRDGEVTSAAFLVGERRWEVRVRTTPGQPRSLTCGAARPNSPLQHELLSVS